MTDALKMFHEFVESTGPLILGEHPLVPIKWVGKAELELRDTALERRALRLCGHCDAPRNDDDTKCPECGARS